jgi:hypothetical protein
MAKHNCFRSKRASDSRPRLDSLSTVSLATDNVCHCGLRNIDFFLKKYRIISKTPKQNRAAPLFPKNCGNCELVVHEI